MSDLSIISEELKETAQDVVAKAHENFAAAASQVRVEGQGKGVQKVAKTRTSASVRTV